MVNVYTARGGNTRRMAELAFVASGLVMGLLLVVLGLGLARMRDWRAYAPGFVTVAGDEEDGTMRVVWVLLGISLVATLAIVITAMPPLSGNVVWLFGLLLAAVLAAYTFWGSYHVVRSNGRQTAEAAMVGAWVLGGLSLLGITVLLVLG